jgi:aerobic carbon-monoxide dehydrogenase medium subunit
MYAAEFDYYKADSVGDAIRLLRSHEGAKLLAGGHSLLPLMKLRLARPPAVIDIGGIRDLKGITRHDNTLRIGALTTHWEIASSEVVKDHCPLLAEVASGIGDPQVRNRGTIGGNVAHADPASDWPTVLTALDARFLLQGPGLLGGRSTVAVGDFFKGAFTTALEDDQVLTAIEVPVMAGRHHEHEHGHGHGHGHDHHETHGQVGEYAKMAHPASYYAVVGGAVVVTIENNQCTAARIAVGGLTPSPVRARSVEAALVGKELTQENIAQAADHLADDLGDDVFGDIYASAEFRRSVVPVEIRHALYHVIGTAHH